MDQESSNLHLPLGVEGHKADVCGGEGLAGVLDLAEDLGRVGAAEHGQLVHCPVPAAREKTLATGIELELSWLRTTVKGFTAL